ncbi:MAG: hypothetical protein L0212_03690 [Acidobacteria bacterium]|nr:hypothetical protein [Acidobacteriota bacterium]
MGSTPQPSSSSGGLAPNIAALLGYLIWIVAIVWLVLDPYKNDRFIRFHAFQAIGLVVVVIGLSIVGVVLSIILAFIPYVGPIIALLLWPVIWLAILGIWIFLMYKAYSNEMWKLPIIGNFAEKMAGG